MLSVDEALQRVMEQCTPLTPVRRPLLQALGCVMAEKQLADRDSPPWDKSMVDGYALRSADLAIDRWELEILEELTAGKVATRAIAPGEAIRIMTGAPLPAGADAVVMIERTEVAGEGGTSLGRVRIEPQPVKVGMNILARGKAMRAGDTVLEPGSVIRPAEVGLLCEIGCTEVSVHPQPSVAVLATGDELVAPQSQPAPGQIRNSNGPMLTAAILRAGGDARDLGVARDEPSALRLAIEEALRADVLLLSGGVSAGVLDLVPGMLREAGVEEIFHKVNLKPGKPLWFGVKRGAGATKLVFGLPGNPVSSLVCFELFARPAMARLAGNPTGQRPLIRARLGGDHQHRGDRPTFFPSLLSHDDAGAAVQPVGWQGSADLRGLSRANALACFPAGDRLHRAGETIEVMPI